MHLSNIPSSSLPAPDWLSQLISGATQILTVKQQNDLAKINLKRMERGEEPIDPSDYSPGVNVGIAPATRNVLLGLGIAALVIYAVKR